MFWAPANQCVMLFIGIEVQLLASTILDFAAQIKVLQEANYDDIEHSASIFKVLETAPVHITFSSWTTAVTNSSNCSYIAHSLPDY